MRKPAVISAILLSTMLLPAQEKAAAPAYDFSLTREEKIKLAEGAAPSDVSGNAAVYVLEKTGYLKVRDGSNGFSCFVDRQTPWNQEPTCFDAAGTATTLPTRLFVEEQRARGKTEEQIKSDLDEGYTSGRFKAPAKPGIVYMMSDKIFLFVNNKVVHGPPHLMFYAPYATEKDIGSPPGGRTMPHLIRRAAGRVHHRDSGFELNCTEAERAKTLRKKTEPAAQAGSIAVTSF